MPMQKNNSYDFGKYHNSFGVKNGGALLMVGP